ncbi:hypothetical protein TCAL_02810 [Tigriopus californicus]|uniref:IQ motif and ubiquitin-like domain-containing protein n=1 Tax=Tigriopus californicus TaxID=6832 RepID=A0A553NX58_TIGCA|nr:hypothetical protein TCAL_02810 [Tigriopus californicus]
MKSQTIIKTPPNFRKPNLGGYKSKSTGIEYYHASTQTVNQNAQNRNNKDCVSRRIQVTPKWNKYQQTPVECGSQTTEIPSYKDVLMEPSLTYQTAEELIAEQEVKIVVIQKAVRRWLKAKRVLQAKSVLEDHDLQSLVSSSSSLTSDRGSGQDDQEPSGELTEYEQMLLDQQRRLEEEKAKSKAKEADFVARTRKAKQVVAQAMAMAREAAELDRDRKTAQELQVRNVLLKAGQPRLWPTNSRQGTIRVETPSTLKAKEFVQVFEQLQNESHIEGLDRLRAFKNVAQTLESHSHERVVKNLMKLIDRETFLIERQIRPKNLQGLRKRIISEYSRIIRSPKFNPEIQRFSESVPLVCEESSLKSVHGFGLQFCFGCRKHLARIKFPLSIVTNRCKACERLDLKARLKQDPAPYKVIFDSIKMTEEALNGINSPIFQLQTYGPLLLAKIRQRQTSARRHFSKQPILDKYFTKGCLVISGAINSSSLSEEP